MIKWLRKSSKEKKEIFFVPRPNPDNFSPKSVYKKIISNWEKEIRRKIEIQLWLQQILTYTDLCTALERMTEAAWGMYGHTEP